jgi:carboxyl-terminal processing protease
MKKLSSCLIILSILFSTISCKKKKPEKQKEIVETKAPVLKKNNKPGKFESISELVFTLSLLRNAYYDPTKLKPKEMIFAALDNMQSSISSIAFKKIDKNLINIQVDTVSKKFSFENLKDLGNLLNISVEILEFIISNLKLQKSSADEIEDAVYSYINGMLTALDPYSILIKPKYNEEFAMQTRGAYGGVGMVLSIRDYELTVISPTPGAPAIEAGIKEKDKIVQINDRSTVNMSLTDAVSLIRGLDKTSVDIWIRRKDWKKPKKIILVRRRIKIPSVSGKLLEGNIAYLRLNHFISKTSQDMIDEYKKLEIKSGNKIKGIILDLWSNPGGILPQAIYVANAFLEKGVIVSTQGAPGTQKQVFRADKTKTISTTKPMVVLVSSGSASASEIVSGTLKNLNRAVVIGNTTFGKGTVQQIFNMGKKQPTLKLTIQEYLTAGDVSIQQVGVVPHIRIVPIGVINGSSSLFWPDKPRKINKRTKTIKSDNQRPPEKPVYEIRYYKNSNDKKEHKNRVNDYQAGKYVVEFARKFLINSTDSKASLMLKSSKKLVDDAKQVEVNKMITDLVKYKVDWKSVDTSNEKPAFKTEVMLCKIKDELCKTPLKVITPGESVFITIKLTALNKKGSRVYGILKSPASFLNNREFLFGNIEKGNFRYWKSKLVIPKSTSSAIEPYILEIYEGKKGKIAEYKSNIIVKEFEKPRFQISYSIHEKEGGDGIAQKGEEFVIDVSVKNIGKGISDEAIALLINHSKARLFIREGRTFHKKIKPGDWFHTKFTYLVKDVSKPVKIELSVVSKYFKVNVSRKIILPSGAQIKGDGKKFTAILAKNSKIYLSAKNPTDKNVIIAHGSGEYKADGKYGKLCKLSLPNNKIGFSKCKIKKDGKENSSKNLISLKPHIVPPIISLNNKPITLTKDKSIKLLGNVFHPSKLKDFYIIVSNVKSENQKKKVFFKTSNGNKIDFDANVPLDIGLNHILLIARYDKDLFSHILFSIVREKE